MAKKIGNGWVTTDEDERALRRERAGDEPMSLTPLGFDNGTVFRDYEVSNTSSDGVARAYLVELRSLDMPVNTCNCPDFQKNGLGTCKHIEYVLAHVGRPQDPALLASPSAELFMARSPYRPTLLPGRSLDAPAAESLRRHLAPDGSLAAEGSAALAALLADCEAVNARIPDAVRISAEVIEYLKGLRRREELSAAVTDFRARHASDNGMWPFLRTALRPYQVEGALHLASKGRAMLADEMGLGKTIQALAAALLLRELGLAEKALVILPASLRGEWEDHIRNFTRATSSAIDGSGAARAAEYAAAKSFFTLANYDQTMRDVDAINDAMRPDIVILDEAQRIKNWQAKTSRRLKELRAPYAFILTGTPLENKIDDLYSLAEFIDPTLFGSLFRFNRQYYAFDANGHVTGMRNLGDLHAKAATILLRRRKEDVEETLPERTTRTYFTPLTGEQARKYAEFEDTVLRLWGTSRQRPLAAEEFDRLQRALACMRMVCDSCFLLDRENEDSPKLDEMERVLSDIVSSDPTRKIIVFSEWTRMVALAEERLIAMGLDYAIHTGSIPPEVRREEVERFRDDPSCRVFLATETGGTGLNLQVASVVLNLDQPWNPARIEQRVARAWRKRQQNDVLVVNLVSEGTIEHRILSTQKFKQGLADIVLDAKGDAAAFESADARASFMARLTTLVEGPGGLAETAAGRLAADEELRAKIAGLCPEATIVAARRLRVRTGAGGAAPGGSGGVAVLAIGAAEDEGRIRETLDRLAPSSSEKVVEVVSEETYARFRRLHDLGLIGD